MGNFLKMNLIKQVGESRKKILAVGPYVLYAKPYWSNERFDLIKQSFDKSLVVFLPHISTNRNLKKKNFK
jgi:hypothetical protein